jgi:hypothetical protein
MAYIIPDFIDWADAVYDSTNGEYTSPSKFELGHKNDGEEHALEELSIYVAKYDEWRTVPNRILEASFSETNSYLTMWAFEGGSNDETTASQIKLQETEDASEIFCAWNQNFFVRTRADDSDPKIDMYYGSVDEGIYYTSSYSTSDISLQRTDDIGTNQDALVSVDNSGADVYLRSYDGSKEYSFDIYAASSVAGMDLVADASSAGLYVTETSANFNLYSSDGGTEIAGGDSSFISMYTAGAQAAMNADTESYLWLNGAEGGNIYLSTGDLTGTNVSATMQEITWVDGLIIEDVGGTLKLKATTLKAFALCTDPEEGDDLEICDLTKSKETSCDEPGS